MSYTNGEVLRFYVFIESKEDVTGIEITNGRMDVDTETVSVPDGMRVHRVATGNRYITLHGKMGASKHFSRMPDEASAEQELISDKE